MLLHVSTCAGITCISYILFLKKSILRNVILCFPVYGRHVVSSESHMNKVYIYKSVKSIPVRTFPMYSQRCMLTAHIKTRHYVTYGCLVFYNMHTTIYVVRNITTCIIRCGGSIYLQRNTNRYVPRVRVMSVYTFFNLVLLMLYIQYVV